MNRVFTTCHNCDKTDKKMSRNLIFFISSYNIINFGGIEMLVFSCCAAFWFYFLVQRTGKFTSSFKENKESSPTLLIRTYKP
jgi:hypothetical protein